MLLKEVNITTIETVCDAAKYGNNELFNHIVITKFSNF